MAELVLRLRDRELARVGIVKTEVTVGRDASSDLAIDNAAVSRTHATVSYSDGAYRVRDVDSENGIMLNGRRVRKAALEYGDVIGIGKFEIELVASWHEPAQYGAPPAPSKEASKNVMKTMQVDATSAARLRDEAMARIAAQKGLPAPTPKAPPRSAASPAPSRAPAPASAALPVNTGPSTLKLVLLVVAAVIAGALLTLLLLRP